MSKTTFRRGSYPKGNFKNAGRRRLAAGRRATLLQDWPCEGQAFTNAVIASVMAAAAAKIERIAEIAFMAFVLWLAAR